MWPPCVWVGKGHTSESRVGEDQVGVGSVDWAGKTGGSLGGQEQGEDSGWQEEGYPWPRGFGGGLAGRRCPDLRGHVGSFLLVSLGVRLLSLV